MNVQKFVPTTMYVAGIASGLMTILMVGLGLFCEPCTAGDPDATVQGYLATAGVYMLCSLWSFALAVDRRSPSGRWRGVLRWTLYATSFLLTAVGGLVVLEGAVLAEEPSGKAMMGAGVLWAVGAVTLGLAALLRLPEV